MTRYVFKLSQVAADLVVLVIALALAYLLRYEWELPLKAVKVALFVLPYVILLQYVVLIGFGVPRFSWRHIGLREAIRVAQALGVATGVLLGVRLVSGLIITNFGYAKYALIPTGVILIDAIFAAVGIIGVRALRRILAERTEKSSRRRDSITAIPTLLIGAGQGGVMVAKEIAGRPDLGIKPVGFLDDDPNKMGVVIHGISVRGQTKDVGRVAQETGAQQALITFANAPGSAIRHVAAACDEAGLKAKIIPGLYEIVGGQVNLSRMRDVAIEDLLRREPVKLDDEAIAKHVRGKVVMVTGAGGSIGSEMCRQLVRYEPERLLLVEQAENALFNIHRQLRCELDENTLVPCIADVCDHERMNELFATHAPHTVYHAAAHKHVPMMEWNPGEAIKNNVFGTRMVADLSSEHGVESFVMVSTDKAVNPTSVMGASKRAAEIYVQALDHESATAFITVRFGNVLGSTGSVIPIFREQIERGGPVTVTHPDMQRYFMTIPEACQLVLQAGALGDGGEIFILDMGEPVKIVDLAKDLITLSGFRPGYDVEIEYSGVRPGEKLFEELATDEEHAKKTGHPKIFEGQTRMCPLGDAERHLDTLRRAAAMGEPRHVREALASVIPEYTGASDGVLLSKPTAASARDETERPRREPRRSVPHKLAPEAIG